VKAEVNKKSFKSRFKFFFFSLSVTTRLVK